MGARQGAQSLLTTAPALPSPGLTRTPGLLYWNNCCEDVSEMSDSDNWPSGNATIDGFTPSSVARAAIFLAVLNGAAALGLSGIFVESLDDKEQLEALIPTLEYFIRGLQLATLCYFSTILWEFSLSLIERPGRLPMWYYLSGFWAGSLLALTAGAFSLMLALWGTKTLTVALWTLAD